MRRDVWQHMHKLAWSEANHCLELIYTVVSAGMDGLEVLHALQSLYHLFDYCNDSRTWESLKISLDFYVKS